MLGIILFLQQFIVPAVFAIGVIFFLYGVANSFWLGRPDLGHPALLRAMLFFIISLLLFGVLAFLLWLAGGYAEWSADREEDDFGAEVERRRSTLPTPNAPSANDTE